MLDKIGELSRKYTKLISFLFVIIFSMWLSLFFHLEIPTLSVVGTCEPNVIINPTTLSTGIPDTFLMNEDVELSVDIIERPDCEYPLKSAVLKINGQQYNFTENIKVPLDTSIEEESERKSIEVYVYYGGEEYLTQRTIEIISPRLLPGKKFEELYLVQLILSIILGALMIIGRIKLKKQKKKRGAKNKQIDIVKNRNFEGKTHEEKTRLEETQVDIVKNRNFEEIENKIYNAEDKYNAAIRDFTLAEKEGADDEELDDLEEQIDIEEARLLDVWEKAAYYYKNKEISQKRFRDLLFDKFEEFVNDSEVKKKLKKKSERQWKHIKWLKKRLL